MRIKKVVWIAVIAFAAYYLLSRPVSAAGAVTGVGDGIVTGANQLAVFFTHVLP